MSSMAEPSQFRVRVDKSVAQATPSPRSCDVVRVHFENSPAGIFPACCAPRSLLEMSAGLLPLVAFSAAESVAGCKAEILARQTFPAIFLRKLLQSLQPIWQSIGMTVALMAALLAPAAIEHRISLRLPLMPGRAAEGEPVDHADVRISAIVDAHFSLIVDG